MELLLNEDVNVENFDIMAMVENKVEEDLLRFRTCCTDINTSW